MSNLSAFEVPNGLSNIRVKITSMGGSEDEHTRNYYSNVMEWIGHEGRVVSIYAHGGTVQSLRVDGGIHDGHRWEPIVELHEKHLARSYLGGRVTHGNVDALLAWIVESGKTRKGHGYFVHIESDGKVWLS